MSLFNISNLPTELHCQILLYSASVYEEKWMLSHCEAEGGSGSLIVENGPWSLAQVCPLWRAILLSKEMAVLWSNIELVSTYTNVNTHFDVFPEAAFNQGRNYRLREGLQRLRNLPIAFGWLGVNTWHPHVDVILQIYELHYARFKYLKTEPILAALIYSLRSVRELSLVSNQGNRLSSFHTFLERSQCRLHLLDLQILTTGNFRAAWGFCIKTLENQPTIEELVFRSTTGGSKGWTSLFFHHLFDLLVIDSHTEEDPKYLAPNLKTIKINLKNPGGALYGEWNDWDESYSGSGNWRDATLSMIQSRTDSGLLEMAHVARLEEVQVHLEGYEESLIQKVKNRLPHEVYMKFRKAVEQGLKLHLFSDNFLD